MPRRDGYGDFARAQRLALCARQAGRAHQHRGGAGHGIRIAAGLSQPGGGAGRTGLRWRVLCAECGLFAGGAIAGLAGDGRHHGLGAARRRLALQVRREGHPGGGRGLGLCRLHAGPARLCGQERLSRCRARIVRGRRFRAGGRHRRRCTGAGQGALPDAALSLHQRRQPVGRRHLRQAFGHALRHRAHLCPGRGVRGKSRAAVQGHAIRALPRRTCSRASAEHC